MKFFFLFLAFYFQSIVNAPLLLRCFTVKNMILFNESNFSYSFINF